MHSTPKIDAAKLWSLNYRLLSSVFAAVTPDLTALGLETKELLLLAEVDENPHPAELAACLSMPKATVTVNVKRLEAAGFVRRDIDPADLRRHRLTVTPAGRRVMTRGLALLEEAFGERLSRLTATQQTQLKAILEAMV